MVGWDLGSSQISPQQDPSGGSEGRKSERLGSLCVLQHQNKREIFVRWSGKGGTGERRKSWGLRSIPPASPLSLAAQGIWGRGGTKPSYNSAVHLSATCKWTRGLILLALRMKSSQGRSPGPREKTPFHCESLGRDKGLLRPVSRLSCQHLLSPGTTEGPF